jgi:hypothetical protein
MAIKKNQTIKYAKDLSMSNNTLLIRIDERQQFVLKQIREINEKMDSKLDCNDFNEFKNEDFKPVKDKGDKHERNWDRLLGYMIGSGLVGGAAGAGVIKAITALSALAFGG